MPVTRQTVLDAAEFFDDVWELAKGQKTLFGRFGDWISSNHFAVKFVDVPNRLVSTWPQKHQTAFAGMLAQWKSGQDWIPVKSKRGEYGIWRDRKGHETCVQTPYADLLSGLKVIRYDGPGYRGSPLVGLVDGDPVVVVMPCVLPGAGGDSH